MKYLSVLGSTGSIGTQTLDCVRHMPLDFKVSALSAGGNRVDLLAEQILEFHPDMVAVYDETKLQEVKDACRKKSMLRGLSADGWSLKNVEFLAGMEGLISCAAYGKNDIVVTSLVGMIGIRPTIAAIYAGKDIALANKETLVCAGKLITDLAEKNGVKILPVDSEHGAIFQCMQGVKQEDVRKIWLTASGGPFRGYTKEKLESVTLQQALKHPNWAMGAKITIDSATLMNKGLEMIEAKWLFDRAPEDIIPIIHPQSIVHSMIEMKDGSVLAQLGPTDMRLPIEVAIKYPERGPVIAEPLDFRKMSALTFEEVNEEVFPSVAMARHAMQVGGLLPAVFNAANEVAVDRFRKEQISFTDIYRLVEKAMTQFENSGALKEEYSIDDVINVCETTESKI